MIIGLLLFQKENWGLKEDRRTEGFLDSSPLNRVNWKSYYRWRTRTLPCSLESNRTRLAGVLSTLMFPIRLRSFLRFVSHPSNLSDQASREKNLHFENQVTGVYNTIKLKSLQMHTQDLWLPQISSGDMAMCRGRSFPDCLCAHRNARCLHLHRIPSSI